VALTKPFVADLARRETVVSTLKQEYVFVPAAVRDVYLVYLLRQIIAEGSVIVFTSTCRSCEVLAAMLNGLDVPCAALHSQQPQVRRLASLVKFKQGTLQLLIATDVAARGLDIPEVGCVLHHNVPATPADYIHRCGRTARAGRSGRALALVTQYDVELLLAIEAAIGAKLEPLEPTEAVVLALMPEVSSASRAAILSLAENGFLQREKERRAKKRAQQAEEAQSAPEASLAPHAQASPGPEASSYTSTDALGADETPALPPPAPPQAASRPQSSSSGSKPSKAAAPVRFKEGATAAGSTSNQKSKGNAPSKAKAAFRARAAVGAAVGTAWSGKSRKRERDTSQ